MINLSVRTLDARTFDFCVANEITIREFKDKISEKSGIPPPRQRIIFGGRLLPDDQNLRDFDVEGKVLHVAERPPPESLSQSSRRSRNGQRRGVPQQGMRNSPLFRALDGMAVGSMHRLDSGAGASAFNASSSFCMNRITVALHMLDCADNIAAFLEDPSRGLSNQTLDILTRGRWSMESAVVIPEYVGNHEYLADAVQRALSMPAERSGGDVTESIGGSVTQVDATSTAPSADGMVSIEDIGSESDDLPNNNDFDNMPASTSNAAIARPASTAATAATASTSTTGASGNEAENMRTSPSVLADVIDRQRAVQSRLEPFIQQYYELLRNEPTFNEYNPDERVNAQRLYDRVSEAIHYMSHAHHAISDLMLDLSVPAPRHLSCRPILVEESGYIDLTATNVTNNNSNNNNRNPNWNNGSRPTSARTSSVFSFPRPNHRRASSPRSTSRDSTANAPGPSSVSSVTSTLTTSSSTSSERNFINPTLRQFFDEVNGPYAEESPEQHYVDTENEDENESNASHFITVNANNTTAATASPTAGANAAQTSAADLLADINVIPVVVQVHRDANERNVGASNANAETVDFELDLNRSNSSAVSSSHWLSSSFGTNHNNNDDNDGDENSPAQSPPPRFGFHLVRAPDGSLDLMSAARNFMQQNSNSVPNSTAMNAFDRFLPCNSHHIDQHASSESQLHSQAQQSPRPQPLQPVRARRGRILLPRTRNSAIAVRDIGGNSGIIVNSFLNARHSPTNNNNNNPGAGGSIYNNLNTRVTIANEMAGGQPLSRSRVVTTTVGGDTNIGENHGDRQSMFGLSNSWGNLSNVEANERSTNLRRQLRDFMREHLFRSIDMSYINISTATDRAVDWFNHLLDYMPQFEQPSDYDARRSVLELMRRSVPEFIYICMDDSQGPQVFERRITRKLIVLLRRLYCILYECLGETNSELFWSHLVGLVEEHMNEVFHDEAFEFLTEHISHIVPMQTDDDIMEALQFAIRRSSHESTSRPAPDNNDSISTRNLPSEPNIPWERMDIDENELGRNQGTQGSNSNAAIDNEEANNLEHAGDDDKNVNDNLPHVHDDNDFDEVFQALDNEVESLFDREILEDSEPELHDEGLSILTRIPSIIPCTWVPLLTRDSRVQQDASAVTQPPFSDAYISSSEQLRSISNLIESSLSSIVRRCNRIALTDTVILGSPTLTSRQIASIAAELAADATVTNSLEERARQAVSMRLSACEDYTPDRYPAIARFVNRTQDVNESNTSTANSNECATDTNSAGASSSSTSAPDGGNVDATAEANVVIPATDDSVEVSANQSSNTRSYDHSFFDVD